MVTQMPGPMEIVTWVDLVAIPAVGLGAWQLAKHTAEKAVDQRFKAADAALKHKYEKAVEDIRHEHTRAIEALKHDQSRELAHLRGDVDASLNRITKLHQFEFDTLPEAWRLLHVAVGDISKAVRLGMVESPKVSELSSEEMRAFVNGLEWPEVYKDELLKVPHKQAYYDKMSERFDFNKARQSHGELHNYILERGIFIETTLMDALRTMARRIQEVVIEQKVWLEMKGDGDLSYLTGDQRKEARATATAFLKSCGTEIATLEAMVHERLWTVQAKS